MFTLLIQWIPSSPATMTSKTTALLAAHIDEQTSNAHQNDNLMDSSGFQCSDLWKQGPPPWAVSPLHRKKRSLETRLLACIWLMLYSSFYPTCSVVGPMAAVENNPVKNWKQLSSIWSTPPRQFTGQTAGAPCREQLLTLVPQLKHLWLTQF